MVQELTEIEGLQQKLYQLRPEARIPIQWRFLRHEWRIQEGDAISRIQPQRVQQPNQLVV